MDISPFFFFFFFFRKKNNNKKNKHIVTLAQKVNNYLYTVDSRYLELAYLE